MLALCCFFIFFGARWPVAEDMEWLMLDKFRYYVPCLFICSFSPPSQPASCGERHFEGFHKEAWLVARQIVCD